MSASSKKKLQKEQKAAMLTEKQMKEQKEAKKLKAYSISFVAVILVVAIVAVALVSVKGINSSGLIDRFTTAAIVDGNKINSVELSYYYNDIIQSTYNDWQNTYGDDMQMYLALMGLDLSKPLSQQAYDNESTWADYFLNSAIDRAASDYILAEKAKEAGFSLPEEAQANLDYNMQQMTLSAQMWGYTNLSDYLKGIYGFGSSEKSYVAYSQRSALATAYYNNHSAGLKYTDEEIREYETDKFSQYSAYTFVSHYISYTDYLEGGTTDDEGNVTYSEDEKLAARTAAKKTAEELATCTTLEELDAAIAALAEGKENAQKESIKNTKTLYSGITTLFADWLADSSRKSGDITFVANESTTTDEAGNEVKTNNGYYVVMFQSRDDNLKKLANVRHLLVAFEGGTTDSNGNVTYSDAEKGAAKEEAEKLLNEWKNGDATEASFVQLVKDNTDDEASKETGGLYEEILPVQGIYVEAFTNWAIDDERETGDAELVETEYGYHIMYYVGDDELSYRDYLISSDIRTEDMSEWYEGIMENVSIKKENTSRLDMDKVLA